MRKLILLPAFIIMATIVMAQGDEMHYLLPAKKYGKWGYINKYGHWVIPAKYSEAFYFSEGLAAVKYYGKWGYINAEDDWVIEPTFSKAKPFREGLACAMLRNQWGYINKSGAWHIQPDLSVVSSFSDGLALIKSGEGFIFIGKNGERLISSAFERALPFAEGMAFVIYNGYKGYIDRRGNWLIKHDFEEAYSFSEGLALVRQNGKYGFINTHGQLSIDHRFDDANYFREGLAAINIGGQWGYINRYGKVIIGPEYELAYPFSEGFAVVKKDDRYGLINREGTWVIRPIYSGLGRYTNSISIEDEVKNVISELFAKWQLKGEFEKTEDYMHRISSNNLQIHMDSLAQIALRDFAGKYIDFEHASIGLYDADLERFNVFIPGARSIMLPVPLGIAPEFKEDWNKVWLGNAEYTISGDKFIISKLEARYQGESLLYDASEDYLPGGHEVLHVNVEDIQVKLPHLSMNKDYYTSPGYTLVGRSDVDTSIPVTKIKNTKTFALIIGNEDYSSYQMDLNPASNVAYAEIDAKIFKEYAHKTLGIPDDNITLLINATAGQMRHAMAKMSAIAKAYEGEAKLIFYYAGHGLPHEETKDPYLIPVDVNGSNLDYAIKLEDAYRKLTEHKSERVTVFLDACFSGGARNEELIATRGIRIRPKSPFVLGNLIVLSAAAGTQSAHPYHEKAHGMFTYYLLKGLQVSDGLITYGDLADLIHTYVKRKSILVNEVEQEPEITVSPIFEDSWKEMTFFKTDALPIVLQN